MYGPFRNIGELRRNKKKLLFSSNANFIPEIEACIEPGTGVFQGPPRPSVYSLVRIDFLTQRRVCLPKKWPCLPGGGGGAVCGRIQFGLAGWMTGSLSSRLLSINQ